MSTLWTGLLPILTFGALTVAFVAEVTEFDRPGSNDVNSTTQSASGSVQESWQPKLEGVDAPGRWASFAEMHQHYTHAFVESQGFGLNRIRTFTEPEYRILFVDEVPHRVANLQLIGMLNDEPVIYDAKWVGISRNALEHYDQRTPTLVESTSLSKLRSGAPYVWMGERPVKMSLENASIHSDQLALAEVDVADSKKKRGTLVAALRATKRCMDCHQAVEGELLGAFLYEMEPVTKNDLERQLRISAMTSQASVEIEASTQVISE